MNRVTLIGRIGQDPEIITTDNGKIAKFSLATDESYKDKNGNKVEQTEWHSIIVFGKQAEVVEKYFKKGGQMCVEGKIKTDSWEKDGEKKYKTNVILQSFEFLSSTKQSENVPQQSQQPQQNQSFNPNNQQDDLPW